MKAFTVISSLDHPPKPSLTGSFLFLIGLIITAISLQGHRASDVAHGAAVGVLISLTVSVYMDWKEGGLWNLIRADLMAILALYFLTLIEFFAKQDNFNDLVPVETVRAGVETVLWGFAGLVVGRHLVDSRRERLYTIFTQPVRPRTMLGIFWFSLLIGYSYQFFTCGFNPLAVFEAYMGPRFSQPWSREQFGGWLSFFTELEMLIYLIPPIAGVILAKHRQYTSGQLLAISIGLGWTLCFGFFSGTRNVFDCYLVTFFIAYISATRQLSIRAFITIGIICIILLFISTKLVLQFREVGFRAYINGNVGALPPEEEGLFIDNNLYVICELVQIFPKHVPYLGWEVPYLAIIRPVPRALWPGKPEGLSTGIEKALGAEGLTLASTFIGEAYIAFGNVGVFLSGLFFGVLARWWSRFANHGNSDLGIFIYASGFFAASISMRSLFVFTTAILPTIAAIVGGSYLLKNIRNRIYSSNLVGTKRNP
jgi:hypothetical protein